MNHRQIIIWLGFRPGTPGWSRRLRPEIVAGMADVKDPVTAEEQIVAFRAFLKCAPIPEQSIFRRQNDVTK